MLLSKIKEIILLAIQLTATGILMTLALLSAFIVVPYMMLKFRRQLRTMCHGESGKIQPCEGI
jgi:Na+-transporting methylmalonyl-CoA/oxaloacetate decarboxylase gamma subunit